MKTILIISGADTTAKPLIDDLGYSALYSYHKKNGVELCRASISAFNPKTGIFREAQFLVDGNWVWRNNIIPDEIYDKSKHILSPIKKELRKLISEAYPFYNNAILSEIMSDKMLTFTYFGKFSPKTVLITCKDDLEKINGLQDSRIIVKPLSASGGKGIFITEKSKGAEEIERQNYYPVIAQNFIKSSRAQNAFTQGCNDIRIFIRNTTPFYCYIRKPQKGYFIANMSRGASLEVIPIEKIMEEASVASLIKKIIQEVESISASKKLYAIDAMLDDDGNIWLLEMNSRPGLILVESERSFQELFYENLFKFFNA